MQQDALREGAVFHEKYQIIRSLAQGGMGAVYEVLHLETQRRRALKVMLPSVVHSEELRNRFRAEARVAAGIESEHIVETFDAGVDRATGMPFLVMELLKGEELADALQRTGRMPPERALPILSQVARTLDKTHAARVVHRDLKPENIFLTVREDGSPHAKILDFGIAKVVAEGAGADKTRSLGTPLYMAPEQFDGSAPISAQTDLFALAHITFAVLVGRAYWSQEMESSPSLYGFLMAMQSPQAEPAVQRAARFGVSLPPAFDAWFARATSRVAAQRFGSAGEQQAALEGIYRGFSTTIPQGTPSPIATLPGSPVLTNPSHHSMPTGDFVAYTQNQAALPPGHHSMPTGDFVAYTQNQATQNPAMPVGAVSAPTQTPYQNPTPANPHQYAAGQTAAAMPLMSAAQTTGAPQIAPLAPAQVPPKRGFPVGIILAVIVGACVIAGAVLFVRRDPSSSSSNKGDSPNAESSTSPAKTPAPLANSGSRGPAVENNQNTDQIQFIKKDAVVGSKRTTKSFSKSDVAVGQLGGSKDESNSVETATILAANGRIVIKEKVEFGEVTHSTQSSEQTEPQVQPSPVSGKSYIAEFRDGGVVVTTATHEPVSPEEESFVRGRSNELGVPRLSTMPDIPLKRGDHADTIVEELVSGVTNDASRVTDASVTLKDIKVKDSVKYGVFDVALTLTQTINEMTFVTQFKGTLTIRATDSEITNIDLTGPVSGSTANGDVTGSMTIQFDITWLN
ncbi:MAG: protein kinase [Polyangiaceae bacterium]